MEKKIFEEGMARLKEAAVVAYIVSKGFEAPKHQAWFEDQFDQSLAESENQALPFDLPAILWQFGETKYEKGNGNNQEAEGTIILHIGQNKYVDGVDGAATLADHKKLLEYAELIIDLLNGKQLPCSAKPYLTNHQRDHINRPMMIDQVTFSWTGRRHKRADAPA